MNTNNIAQICSTPNYAHEVKHFQSLRCIIRRVLRHYYARQSYTVGTKSHHPFKVYPSASIMHSPSTIRLDWNTTLHLRMARNKWGKSRSSSQLEVRILWLGWALLSRIRRTPSVRPHLCHAGAVTGDPRKQHTPQISF